MGFCGLLAVYLVSQKICCPIWTKHNSSLSFSGQMVDGHRSVFFITSMPASCAVIYSSALEHSIFMHVQVANRAFLQPPSRIACSRLQVCNRAHWNADGSQPTDRQAFQVHQSASGQHSSRWHVHSPLRHTSCQSVLMRIVYLLIVAMLSDTCVNHLCNIW